MVTWVKQLLKYLIYEQAINVIFEGLSNNLVTAPTDKYKVGKHFTSLSRMYTADEYGSETGMYQQDNVAYIEIVYRHVKILKLHTKYICIEYSYSHSTRYERDDNAVINGISSGGGEVCLLVADLNKYWKLE